MPAIKEGSASLVVPEGVFYNPKMQKLRDISVMFLNATCGKDAKLLDCTAASGIRAIRYALECGIKDATLLDINPIAAKCAKTNVKRNKLKLRTLDMSVQEFASTCEGAFDVIDLDPFGSPVPYIHDLLKISKGGTLLMVTATDMATLCGAERSACLKIYGAEPAHNDLCHEAGIRILVNYVTRAAAQFNFGIEPALCISDMHYMRVFIFLKRGANDATASVRNSGFGSFCTNCCSFSYEKGIIPHVETVCGNCGGKMSPFGPLWLGPLQDKKIIARILANAKDKDGAAFSLLTKVNEELELPFFYNISMITKYLGISSVPMEGVIAALSKKHGVSKTHFDLSAIKTDANIKEVISAVSASHIV